MPEVLCHIRNINKYYEKQNKSAEAANAPDVSSDLPKMAQTVLSQTALSKIAR